MKSNPVHPVRVTRVSRDQAQVDSDELCTEQPLQIEGVFGEAREAIAVTLRTPGHDLDLALGFAVSEGLVSISDRPRVEQPDDDRVCVHLPADVVKQDRVTRFGLISPSCGLCGKTTIEALHASGLRPVSSARLRPTTRTLMGLPTRLKRRQSIFRQTGGLHAAALFNEFGDIETVREDIGRHNAVDKVIGAALNERLLPSADRGLLLSGRVGFDLVQKAAVARIPLIAAVGAPSSLAVLTAREFNIGLIGFLSATRYNVYA